MAKYLVLIYGDEKKWATASPEWQSENGRRHSDFQAEAGAAVIGGAELQPSATAVCLRGDAEGNAAATDGPFVESKEALGGYYLLEAPDVDAAIALARRVPEATADGSGVEIRRLVDTA